MSKTITPQSRPSTAWCARMLRLKIACIGLPLAFAGCSSVPLKEAGTLTSYNQLGPAKGKFNKSRTFVDGRAFASVKSVSISPTVFSASAASRVKQVQDRALVLNALDRAMCVALSDKYQVVAEGQPADLTVKSTITDLVPTEKITAGVSKAVSLGSSAVLPVGIPRLPMGFGGLAVEAEALDRNGVQRAAIVWSRGANSFTNEAMVSEIGDAYSLGSTFGNDFSRMLVSGKPPAGLQLSIPSGQHIKSFLGGKPKYAACEAFGRAPGLFGMIGAKVGAPPSWTDKSAKIRPNTLAVHGPANPSQ